MVEKKSYKKGDIIFKKGQWEMKMYDIISGKVGIYDNYGQTDEKLLTELNEGKLFGEMAIIEAFPRSATAVALEDTDVNVVDSDGVTLYFKTAPERINGIMENLANRLRELSDDYVNTCSTIAEYLDTEDSSSKKEGLFAKIKKALLKKKELEAMDDAE